MIWLQTLLETVGKIFGWASARNEEYNTPEMKARHASEKEVEAVSSTEKAVKANDVEQIRRELAE